MLFTVPTRVSFHRLVSQVMSHCNDRITNNVNVVSSWLILIDQRIKTTFYLALNRILGWIVDPRIATFGNVTESFVCARPCVILYDITDAFGCLGYIRDGINHPRHVELRVR